MQSRIIRPVTLTLAVAVLGLFQAVGLLGAASTQAQPPTYLPWPAGQTYHVTQGNHGPYSHNTDYTRYGWDFGLPYGASVASSAPGRVASAVGYCGGGSEEGPGVEPPTLPGFGTTPPPSGSVPNKPKAKPKTKAKPKAKQKRRPQGRRKKRRQRHGHHGQRSGSRPKARQALVRSSCNSGWGNSVVVCYGDGTCSRYGHLSAVVVGVGQSVGQGQLLGRVGSTGNSSGPHLHYQLENSRGISLPSSFAEAGVPRAGQAVTSRNAGAPPRVLHVTLDSQFPMDGQGVVHISRGDGPKVPIGFDLRNDGNAVWGNARIVLITDVPGNLRNAFGWETPSQIPGDRHRVAPGETMRVRFLLNPEEINETGDYFFKFRVRDLETGEWAAGAEPSFTLRIEPGCFAARAVSQQIPPLLEPGQTGSFTVALRNVGSCLWRRGEVSLATRGDEPFTLAGDDWHGNRNRVFLTEETVGPSEVGHFRATVKAPADAKPERLIQPFVLVTSSGQRFGEHLGLWIPVSIGDAEHPPYQASDYRAEWVSQTYPDGPLVPGEKTVVTVTFRNTGPATLFAGGQHPVNLRGSRPYDRGSGFIEPDGPGVVDRNRGVRMTQDRVAPGEEFSFRLPVKVLAGLPPGPYPEYFRPVAEGLTWFGPEGVYWPFTVADGPCYKASIISQRVSPLVAPGSAGELSFTLRNRGPCAWKQDKVRLATKGDQPFPFADGTWQGNRNRITMAEQSVEPGELAHFTAQIAPAASSPPARLKQYFELVGPGGERFADELGIFLMIFVGDPDHLPYAADDYRAEWVTQTYADHTLSRGERLRLKVTFRNTGWATLFHDGPHPVNLRGIRPEDRGSGFVDPEAPETVGWNKGAKLDQARVNPGEEFSFTLPIKVHDVVGPGPYKEYFRPIAEGTTWFGPDGVYWPFTVN